jgi:hypothetical protein
MTEARRRGGSVIPFGWEISPENPAYLVAIPRQIAALAKAKEYLANGVSWRSLQDWVIRATGRKISVTGLRVALGVERVRGRSASKKGPRKETSSEGDKEVSS